MYHLFRNITALIGNTLHLHQVGQCWGYDSLVNVCEWIQYSCCLFEHQTRLATFFGPTLICKPDESGCIHYNSNRLVLIRFGIIFIKTVQSTHCKYFGTNIVWYCFFLGGGRMGGVNKLKICWPIFSPFQAIWNKSNFLKFLGGCLKIWKNVFNQLFHHFGQFRATLIFDQHFFCPPFFFESQNPNFFDQHILFSSQNQFLKVFLPIFMFINWDCLVLKFVGTRLSLVLNYFVTIIV